MADQMHTPGDLAVCEGDGHAFRLIGDCAAINSNAVTNVAVVEGFRRTREENEANAHRLALAWNCHDELLEALVELVDVINAAGLHNLCKGVEIGPTAWLIKATDVRRVAMDAIKAALPQTEIRAEGRDALIAEAHGLAGRFGLTLDTPDDARKVASLIAYVRATQSARYAVLPAGQHIQREPMAGWKPSDGYVEPTPAAPRLCCCIGGICRHEVINGRCANGDHCKAHLQPNLSEDTP